MNSKEHAAGSYLQAIHERGREANPFFHLMGIDVLQVGQAEATLTMSIRPDMLNGVGWLQGGIFVSLADEAMALALYAALGETARIATVTESTSFVKGIRGGTVIATGRVVKTGRRLAFTEGDVRSETPGGDLLARTTALFAVLDVDSRCPEES